MTPQRIVILGNAGSGKSSLARVLAQQLSLPVVHLDCLYWGAGWVKPGRKAFRQRVANATDGLAWICEGNYHHQTFDLRLPKADLVIWMDTPRLTCARRVALRALRQGPRADLPDGCAEKLDRDFFAFLGYVWRFDRVYRPAIEALRHVHGPDVPVIRLRDRRQADAFATGLGPADRRLSRFWPSMPLPPAVRGEAYKAPSTR